MRSRVCSAVALDAIDALPVVFDRQVVFGWNGMVIFYSTLVSIKFACAFDVSHFPTDSHKCRLRFGQWTSSKFHYRISQFTHPTTQRSPFGTLVYNIQFSRYVPIYPTFDGERAPKKHNFL